MPQNRREPAASQPLAAQVSTAGQHLTNPTPKRQDLLTEKAVAETLKAATHSAAAWSSVDRWFHSEPYDSTNYNCAHFATKVWHDITGHDISLFTGVPQLEHRRRFVKLPAPVSPCICFGHTRVAPHIGIYIRGKVLHFCREGVMYEDLSRFGYLIKKVRFYVTRNDN